MNCNDSISVTTSSDSINITAGITPKRYIPEHDYRCSCIKCKSRKKGKK